MGCRSDLFIKLFKFVCTSNTNNRYVFRSGADPDRTNGDGETASDLAERGGREDVALLLKEWATDSPLQ